MHGPTEFAPIGRIVRWLVVLHRLSRPDGFRQLAPIGPLIAHQIDIATSIVRTVRIQGRRGNVAVSIRLSLLDHDARTGQIAADDIETALANMELLGQSRDGPGTS